MKLHGELFKQVTLVELCSKAYETCEQFALKPVNLVNPVNSSLVPANLWVITCIVLSEIFLECQRKGSLSVSDLSCQIFLREEYTFCFEFCIHSPSKTWRDVWRVRAVGVEADRGEVQSHRPLNTNTDQQWENENTITMRWEKKGGKTSKQTVRDQKTHLIMQFHSAFHMLCH